MRICPLNNTNKQISYKGSLEKNTASFLKDMGGRWLDKASEMKTIPLINTCLFSSERINNVYLNLSTMMERFGHGCKLTFAKSEKTSKYRFYIENDYSNYKIVCKDIEFSPNINKLTDIDKLENLENTVVKLNPYQENSNFIIQRKAEAKSAVFDKEFEPDSDCIFIEDMLVRKEQKEATMDDLEEFLKSAKEEGLIDG